MNSGDKRLTGVIKSWDDDKGFGFIELEGRRKDIFFHISAFETPRRRPSVGDEVIYVLEEDTGKGPRAAAVWLRGEPLPPETGIHRAVRRGAILRLLIFPLYAFYCAALGKTVGFEPGVLLWHLPISAICFWSYADDKARAQRGWRRTPESFLIFWGVIGGWPGGLLAQLLYWHKTTKSSFQSSFWFSVGIGFILTAIAGAIDWKPFVGGFKPLLFDFLPR